MNDHTVLYVGQDSDRVETVTRDLQAELSELAVQGTTPDDSKERLESDSPGCIVYECGETNTAPIDFFEGVRAGDTPVPFLLFVSPDTGIALDWFLAREHTSVVRQSSHSEDMAVLANRIEGLLESYRHKQELERERDRFETLFEKLTQPTVETEFEGNTPVVKRVNRAFEEVFGYDESEMVGEPLDDFVVPPDSRDEAAAINDRVLDGEVFSVEATRQTADGEREFLLRNAVYPDTPDEFAMYTDITERKKRDRRLQRQRERLEEFASTVSHDLRIPLGVIKGRVDLARKTGNEEHFDAIDRATDRMGQILEETLTLASAGEVVEETDSVSLADVARRAWDHTQTDSAEFILDVSDTVTVHADRNRLLQIFENLFRNALEHNDPPVSVRVGILDGYRSEDTAPDFGFFVADDGCGIPPDKRDAVFEQGYSRSERGTGFGLAIVEDIIAAHGWQITVVESSDSGARFEITNVDLAEK